MSTSCRNPQPRRDAASSAVRVQRYDRAEAKLDPAVVTPQGYLRVHAAIAKPGILEYEYADGRIVRELIPRSELHRADSLLTLASTPVTVQHPDEDVTPDNVGDLGVGDVGEEVQVLEETGHVRVVLVIRRRDGLDAVKDGITEVSPGYTAVIDATPGTDPEFGPYDAIQTMRRYNHVALVDEARGGPTVKLRADGARAVARVDGLALKDPAPAAVTPPISAHPSGGRMHPSLITLAAFLGLSYTQRADGKCVRTDTGTEVDESKLTAAIVSAIGGLKAEAEAAADKGDEEGTEDVAALKAKIAELEGKIAVYEQAKADMEAEAEKKADALERTRLDALAKAIGFNASQWRADTKTADRKLDLVRHRGVVKADAKPVAVAVDGMIEALVALHMTADERADGTARADTRSPWSIIGDQVDASPGTRRDGQGDDHRTDAVDDPFKAALAKRIAVERKSA